MAAAFIWRMLVHAHRHWITDTNTLGNGYEPVAYGQSENVAEQGVCVADAALYHYALCAGGRQRKRLLARDFLQELSRGHNKEERGAKVRRHRREVPKRVVSDIKVVLQPHGRAGRGCSTGNTTRVSAQSSACLARGGGGARRGGYRPARIALPFIVEHTAGKSCAAGGASAGSRRSETQRKKPSGDRMSCTSECRYTTSSTCAYVNTKAKMSAKNAPGANRMNPQPVRPPMLVQLRT